jgi:hypothetical protein
MAELACLVVAVAVMVLLVVLIIGEYLEALALAVWEAVLVVQVAPQSREELGLMEEMEFQVALVVLLLAQVLLHKQVVMVVQV